MHRLLTRDPVSGHELIVTRLECPETGIVIEGDFSLGWIARLSPDQLDFVGALLRQRGNVQKLAAEAGVAYNTARNRLDAIVDALGGQAEPGPVAAHGEVLARLQSGEIDYDRAMAILRGEETE